MADSNRQVKRAECKLALQRAGKIHYKNKEPKNKRNTQRKKLLREKTIIHIYKYADICLYMYREIEIEGEGESVRERRR